MSVSYRALLRELRHPKNTTIIAHFRSLVQRVPRHEFENAIHFLRAQKEHNRLLERYNPSFDLTSQQRIAATAHRVGLNMPKSQ